MIEVNSLVNLYVKYCLKLTAISVKKKSSKQENCILFLWDFMRPKMYALLLIVYFTYLSYLSLTFTYHNIYLSIYPIIKNFVMPKYE